MNKHKNVRWPYRERIRLSICAAALLLTAASTWALAGNRTFTGAFDGSEDTMPSTISSCAPSGGQQLGYLEAGVFTVDTNGEYVINDAGNIGFGGLGGIQDASVLIYEGSFDPNNPAANRIAAVDTTFNEVTQDTGILLGSGVNYVMVIQHWCDTTVGTGPWGVVMDGPGGFSGIGFPSSPSSLGNWSNVTDTAIFGVGNAGTGTRKYRVARTFSPAQSGEYAFVDVSDMYESGPTAALIYEGTFDPQNASDGFLEDLGFGGTIILDSDKTYTVVLIDAFIENGRFQSVTYSAGQAGMGTHINGAWFNPATSGQGVLMDYGPNTAGGLLFLAWFTFDTTNSSSSQVIGDSNQRWLTGSGTAAEYSTAMDVMFANTADGIFNQQSSAQVTDGNYGVGTVNVDSCEAVTIDFELPGGNDGSMTLGRGLPQEIEACYGQTGVGLLIR